MSTNLFRVLGKDIFTYGVMQVLDRGISFLLFPILAKILAIEEFGLFDMFSLFIGLLTVLSSLQLNSAIARYYKNDDSNSNNAKIYSSLFIISIIFNLLCFLLVFLFSSQISQVIAKTPEFANLVILSAIIAMFDNFSNLGLILLRRQRKIIKYSIINIIGTIIYTIFAIAFIIKLDYGVEGLIFALLIGRGVKFLLTIFFTKSLIQPYFQLQIIKKALKYSLPMVPAVAGTWADQQSNRIILLYLIGLSGVGLFGGGARIAMLIVIVTMVFRQAWVPFALEIIEKPNRNEIYIRTFKYYFGAFSILGIILTCFSPELLYILTPKEYFLGYSVIPWLVGAHIIHNGGGIINIGTLVSEKTGMNSVAAWIGLSTNIVLCYFLVQYFGIGGAALGMMISKLLASIILLRRSEKLINISFEKLYGLKVLGIFVGFSIIFLSSLHFIDFYSEFWVSILVRTSSCLFAIFLIFCLTRDSSLNTLIKQLILKFKKT